MKRNKLNLKIYLLSIGVLLMAVAAMAEREVVDRVVARVNDEIILYSEFSERFNPVMEEYGRFLEGADLQKGKNELKENVLDQIIDEKLLLQKARLEGITVSDEEIDQGIGEIRNRFPTEMEFKDEIARQGLTGGNFRENIKDQLKVIKLINEKIRDGVSPPTEEDARNYYMAHEEQMVSPEQVQARHILVRSSGENSLEEDKEKIREIYEKVIQSPENFGEFAREYSECGSAVRGGDLGSFSRGDMVTEFEEVAFNLDINEVSEPFKTRFGYHIVKVIGRRGSEKRSYEEVKDNLKNMLYQMEMEREYERFLRSLRDESRVSKNLF